jgi:hypothetical protein
MFLASENAARSTYRESGLLREQSRVTLLDGWANPVAAAYNRANDRC